MHVFRAELDRRREARRIDRVHAATEPRAGLAQHDVDAGVAEHLRRREARNAAADDGDGARPQSGAAGDGATPVTRALGESPLV